MAQVINTNVMSLNTQRTLNRSQAGMQVSLERLSSGLRINRAKDDAAGLAISERFTSQIRGLDQGIRNANDGISLLQTAEGALSEVSNSLQRMRELAVQAKNGTVTASDRASLNDEFQALKAEITRISDVTEFNNTVLLGTTGSISLQVGWENGTNNVITLGRLDIRTESFGSGGIANILSASTMIGSTVSGASAGSVANAGVAEISAAMGFLDTALDKISNLRGDFGAIQNRLESAVRNMENVIENQSAARSRILDADFARETANLTRTQILQQAGTAMLAQANQLPQNVLSLLR
jgi:flagellin